MGKYYHINFYNNLISIQKKDYTFLDANFLPLIINLGQIKSTMFNTIINMLNNYDII